MSRSRQTLIDELEKELEYLFRNAKSPEAKPFLIQEAFLTQVWGVPEWQKSQDKEYREYCRINAEKIDLLNSLYRDPDFVPESEITVEDDKKTLSYLISDNMTKEQILKVLGDAHWEAHNSGYCDSMANRLMAGQEDAQTERWEKNCKNKAAIKRLYDRIKESECD